MANILVKNSLITFVIASQSEKKLVHIQNQLLHIRYIFNLQPHKLIGILFQSAPYNLTSKIIITTPFIYTILRYLYTSIHTTENFTMYHPLLKSKILVLNGV